MNVAASTGATNEAHSEHFYLTYTNNELSDSNNNKMIEMRKKFTSNLKNNRGTLYYFGQITNQN
jgi:hypothetical protein